MASLADNDSGIIDDLAASGAQVLSDAESLEFHAHDLYARGADLLAVIVPDNKDQLAAAVSLVSAGEGSAESDWALLTDAVAIIMLNSIMPIPKMKVRNTEGFWVEEFIMVFL